MNVLLSGIVGSTAYGLNGPDSDIDRLGMYAEPTIKFHGLYPPTRQDASIVQTKPDITMHEAGKFVHLCLSGNPTVMELLWLSEYETKHALGQDLIDIRKSFLSARKVRGAYLDYATQQFERLERRGDGSFSADTRKRTAKHARHMMRLCHQGFILYATGKLVIKVDDPQWFFDFGEDVASGNINRARDLILTYEDVFDRAKTVLPELPDFDTVEKWLLKVRAVHL